MDLTKLRAFIVVAEELNFRKSAEILGMSQPPLTRLISAFEEELSTQLFERTTRNVKLTGAGFLLLKEGKEIMSAVEKMEQEVRSIGKVKRGALSIGFSATAYLARLPRILDQFRDRFPKIDIELYQESKREILKGLKSGRFDTGILEGPIAQSDLQSHLIQDEVLGVLLPKKHPLAKRKEIDLIEIKNETIILHPEKDSQNFREMVHQIFRNIGEKPKLYLKNERESCPILVATGKGVSLTISGTKNIVPEETSFVPLKNLFLPVSALWDSSNENPALKSFLSFTESNRSLMSQNYVCLEEAMKF